MELLESTSSWITALAKTLLNSLWLGLVLLAMLKMLFILIPERLASFRYNLALFLMFMFAALSVGIFFQLYSPLPEAVSSSISGSGEMDAKPLPFYNYICVAYLLGMAMYLIKVLIGLGTISKLRSASEIAEGPWHELFCRLKLHAGISGNVDFLISDRIVSPFLTGIFKPAIIVPASMLTQLSFKEVESILMHELYHLRKWDHWMNMIQVIIEVIFFFNPVIWILSKIIRIEREKRCDDLVLKDQGHPLEYARALYHLSLQHLDQPSLVNAASGRGKGELKNRIERIINPNTMKTNFREKTYTLLLFLGGLALLLLVSGFSSGLSISLDQSLPQENQPADTLSQEEKQKILMEVEEAIADVDWEEIKKEMEGVKLEALEEIDWEEIKKEMEDVRLEALEEIDWEEIKIEIEDLHLNLDQLLEDLDLEMDFDFDMDMDVDVKEEKHPDKN